MGGGGGGVVVVEHLRYSSLGNLKDDQPLR